MNPRLIFTAVAIALLSVTEAAPLDWLKPDALSVEHLNRLKSELGLTSDQEAKLNQILAEAKQKSDPLEASLRKEQQALEALLRDHTTTTEAASDGLAKMLHVEAALKQNQLRAILTMRGVLTQEQQKLAARASHEKGLAPTTAGPDLSAKIARLKAAVGALGIPLTEAMKDRGEQIEYLLKSGSEADAAAAVDKLIADSGINEKEDNEGPEFSKSDPGDTELSALKDRFAAVEGAAQTVVSLPLLRKLIKAKDAFEKARQEQDAITVGRVLTWAEKALEKPKP